VPAPADGTEEAVVKAPRRRTRKAVAEVPAGADGES
jgi:hypothetical protein